MMGKIKQFMILILVCTMYKNSQAQSCELSHIPELTLRVASPYNQQNNGETYRLVGFFPAFLKSKFNKSGFVWIEAAKFAFLELLRMFHNSGLFINMEFLIYDTCDKINIASMQLLNLLLGSLRENTISNCCNKDLSNNVIGLIGPASSSTTDHVLKLLSSNHYPVISYSSTSVRFSDKTLYPTFMRTIPPDNLQARLMLDLLLKFNWTYVSIVAQDNEYGRMGMNELNKLFVQHKICTSIETVFNHKDKNNIRNILKQIYNDPLSNVIILWASIKGTLPFLKEAQEFQLYYKTFILGESANENPDVLIYDPKVVHGVLSVVPDSGVYRNFENNFRNMTYKEHASRNPWLKAFFENHLNVSKSLLNKISINDYWTELPMIKNGNVYNAVFAYGYAIKNFIERNSSQCSGNNTTNCLRAIVKDRMSFFKNYLQYVEFKDLQQRPATFDNEGNTNSTHYFVSSPQFIGGKLKWKRVGIWNKKTGLKITSVFRWSNNKTLSPNSRCGSVCAPGYAHREGSKECCWKCTLCQGNAIKLNAGEGLCTTCPPDTYTNKEHTKCLSLKNIFLDYADSAGIVLLSIGLLNTCIIIFFTIVFIKYKKTPVVMSSQLNYSLLQFLFLGLLNFTILLSFHRADEIKCMLYGSITPFLVILAILPTILKTQRLVTVFKAKVILRRHNHAVSKDTIIKTIVLLAIQAILLTISYVLASYHETVTRIDVQLMEIRTGCKFKLLFYLEIIYILLIFVVCGIAAFRARELPTNYNETRVIAYAMFTCSVILTFVFPLYESISDVIGRNVITNFAFLLIDTMILNFMYTPKIWIILFRPNLNTDKHFTVTRLRKINSEIANMYEKRLSGTPTSTRSLIVPNMSSNSSSPVTTRTKNILTECKARNDSFQDIDSLQGYQTTPEGTPRLNNKK